MKTLTHEQQFFEWPHYFWQKIYQETIIEQTTPLVR